VEVEACCYITDELKNAFTSNKLDVSYHKSVITDSYSYSPTLKQCERAYMAVKLGAILGTYILLIEHLGAFIC
jgi:hypothetical protein